MDNFSCHLTDNIKKMCKDQKIVSIMLVPHSSHITQPLDLCIFSSLKSYLQSSSSIIRMIEKKELCEKNEMVENKEEIYEKIIEIHEQEETSIEKRIIEILDAWDKSTSFSNSLSAFEQAGFITKSEPLSKKRKEMIILN